MYRSAEEPPCKADGELLAHLTVVVGSDVPRVGVDADQAGDLAVHAGFFVDLPRGCLANGLAWFDPAAGDRPVLVVGPVDQQDASLGRRGQRR